jgi:acetyl esterase/lipase/uncharacterized membrane protein HdeD (DUF308 family)
VRERETSRRRGWAIVAVGVGMLALAVLLLLRPVASAGDLAPLVAGGFALTAASHVLAARRARTLRFVAGLLWGTAALTVLVWPAPTGRLLAVLLGSTLLVGGGVDLLRYARLPRASNLQFAAAAGALTHLWFGAAILAWPSISVFTLGVALSVWLLLSGVRVVVNGRDRLRFGDRPELVATGGWSPKARIAGSVGMLVVGALAVVSALVVDRDTTPGPDGFYATPTAFDPTPGAVLRREVIDPFVPGATAHRVLYTSRGLQGEPVAVSGIVIVPDGSDVPDGGRPVLAHTHGTIGIDRSCAPSLRDGGYAEQLWGLERFLDAGWIVAAPDYLGLGSDGEHPYLVGASAATNTLDIVRAAGTIAGAEVSDRFAVAGHSQGGHAALFTGQLADEYAPDLDLVGVAALAPASELAAVIEANDGTTFGNLLGAYAVTAWDRVYADLDADRIVDQTVLPVVERLARTCVATGPEALALLTEAELLQLGFLVSPIWETEPWASRIAQNTPGAERINAPLLIVQGTEDVLIRPDIQRRFAARLCEAGQELEYRELPGVGHLAIDDDADTQVVTWLTARERGDPATTTCASD